MKEFFDSTGWNTFVLVILGIVAIITKEIVTFVMLGFILIVLSNIYDKLNDIYKQSERK